MSDARIYLTSDLHLGHANIIRYSNRPYENVQEMNEKLINNWNQTVRNEDRVFFLGDFGLGSREKIINWGGRLNGRKVMIYGNHDHLKPREYYNAGFEQVSKWPIVIQNKYLLSHAPIEEETDVGSLINLYGHVHNNIEPEQVITAHSACVCIEWWEYKPVELRVLEKRISEMTEGLLL